MKIFPQIGFFKSKLDNKQYNFNAFFENGKFKNRIDTPLRSETFSHKDILNVLFRKEKGRMPQYDISLKLPEIEAVSVRHNCFMWLGHSSIFVRLNGINFLVDPVFSGVASPFSLIGPKEYKYSHSIVPQSLPDIECIVVTHNHYDHLDYKTIIHYKDSVKLFIVPLGLAKILKYWGVSEHKIVELDYWQTTSYADVEITATPARHYSRRAFFDKDKTLWMSFVMKSNSFCIFFSGDSGYDTHFKEIGNTFSQFDWAFLECGQYNKAWPYIHMHPEETVKAAKDLNALCAIPIHWGKFSLSLHSWVEPVEIFLQEARLQNQAYFIPKPGDLVTNTLNPRNVYWWREFM